jgi:hypothetical protein
MTVQCSRNHVILLHSEWYLVVVIAKHQSRKWALPSAVVDRGQLTVEQPCLASNCCCGAVRVHADETQPAGF